jgi:2'-5' RNA ligase
MENIHLTVKFLGEISNDQVEKILLCVTRITQSLPGFELKIQSLGCFPHLNRPRVVWLGTQIEGNTLEELVDHIEVSMEELGFEKEKRGFKAHLTLGRVKKKLSADEQRTLEDHILSKSQELIGRFEVAEIHLMQSVLRPSGAEYNSLGSAKLKG